MSEKYVVNYRLEVRNKGGHSSLPVSDNAIYHLAGALDRLSRFAFPLKTNEVTRGVLPRDVDDREGRHQRRTSRKVADGDTRGDGAGRAARRPHGTRRCARPAWRRSSKAATRKNALPQLAAANVNCRVLPDEIRSST